MNRYSRLVHRTCFIVRTVRMISTARFSVHILLLHNYESDYLILHIGTVQSLNCTYLKYELNRSYSGGGGVYVLKSELSRSSVQYVR